MDVRAGGKGSAWKLCIGLAVVCGVLVFAAGFLHRNAVASAIDAQQTKSVSYVHGKLANAVGNDKLTKELGDRAAADLEKEADVPAGTDVRIYALDGTPVFSSGRLGAGDRAAITAAGNGEIRRVVDGSDLAVYASVENKGGKPIAVAAVVSDIDAVRADAVGPLDGFRLPLVALGVVLLVAGLVLMVRGGATKGVAVRAKGDAVGTTKAPKAAKAPKEEAPAKSRVSGFAPAPALAPTVSAPAPAPGPEVSTSDEVEAPPARARKSLRLGRKAPRDAAVPETSEETAPAPKVKKSLFGRSQATAVVPEPADERASSPMTPDREAAIRRMLEDQLEQLRTKIQTQEEAAAAATRQLQEELDAATRRAAEAEARAGAPSDAPPPSVGPAERDMIERLRSLETELAQAKAAAAEAMAQAGELQRTVDAASPVGPQATDAAELVEARARLAAAGQQIEEAQRLAAEAEQRAASNESVRGELEVRVAQLGAKAGELEQKATELETRLQEANAGGDAVRAETAALTAALAGATARVEELESVAPSDGTEDLDAAAAEVTRLRSELASQMERAQAAEDRVARLEADVAAAEHGVPTAVAVLDEAPDEADATPSQHGEAATPTVWIAPGAAEPKLEETPAPQPVETPAPQPTVQTEPDQEPGTNGGHERDGFSEVFAAAFGNEDESEPVRESNGSVEPEPTRDLPVATSPSASLPEAPNANDRYGDVWSEAADEPDKPEEPAVQATAAMTSSLDDEPAPVADEPAPEADKPASPDAAPATEDESVTVEDDLWALRARLAHAADDRETQHSPTDEPRWS